ncbi:hypothetical protein GCM10011610_41850 [Nocardia rhizosphaerihabitans]|uniref:Uncharacterized protein n=1 Tax=Nocardia rhizosphaerihabitans TaxID=1691570 RepID=A0ABQ2KLA9_9NOCA|nr:hypothetical protein GCM10011610_41850 [Nocardia rhizosphaerihabitans]
MTSTDPVITSFRFAESDGAGPSFDGAPSRNPGATADAGPEIVGDDARSA